MKGLKKGAILLAACFMGVSAVSLAACGGDKTPADLGDRTEIKFYCNYTATSKKSWKDMVQAYNDGQGKEDGVYVSMSVTGASVPSENTLMNPNKKKAYNVVTVENGREAFSTIAIKVNSNFPNGLFLNLSPYEQADADFQKNTINKSSMDWWRITYNKDANEGVDAIKHIKGAGQNLLGVPVATNPQHNWYNEKLFKQQGINIVSVPENELEKYNTEHNSRLMPHGYAEYKNAPVSGMTSSQTLDGRTVYKVFNNCIGMNWEEQRQLLKYFSKEYNTSSPTNYGFVSEYWFNYGWSVGGDVIGYKGDGKGYEFTLMDKSANYIVTKDDTVINGCTYKAGEIVRYEDRANDTTLDAKVAAQEVYAIPSMYDAVKEYVSMQVNNDVVVDETADKTYYGYQVGNPDTGSCDTWFNAGTLAMIRGKDIGTFFDRVDNPDFNLCPCETYREYEGGSVYYEGNEKNTFLNEKLMVIGEKYDLNKDGKIGDDEVYTGEIKKVNGTKIIGNMTTATDGDVALCIPACSDPDKYQASWDFISWAATEGQKYVAYNGQKLPIASATLFSEDFAYNTELNKGKNFYAAAMLASNTSCGDWAYFEGGKWVSDWSEDFNNNVRRGNTQLTSFYNAKKDAARNATNNMRCIIKGIR